MKTRLIRIGNSRGIRIPKPLIDECQLGDTVELRVVDKQLVVAAKSAPRAGWAEAFRKAGASTHDELLLDLTANDFDRDEWQW